MLRVERGGSIPGGVVDLSEVAALLYVNNDKSLVNKLLSLTYIHQRRLIPRILITNLKCQRLAFCII